MMSVISVKLIKGKEGEREEERLQSIKFSASISQSLADTISSTWYFGPI